MWVMIVVWMYVCKWSGLVRSWGIIWSKCRRECFTVICRMQAIHILFVGWI